MKEVTESYNRSVALSNKNIQSMQFGCSNRNARSNCISYDLNACINSDVISIITTNCQIPRFTHWHCNFRVKRVFFLLLFCRWSNKLRMYPSKNDKYVFSKYYFILIIKKNNNDQQKQQQTKTLNSHQRVSWFEPLISFQWLLFFDKFITITE